MAARKKISVDILSADSVEALRKELSDYAKKLDDVCETVVDDVSSIGEAYARTGYAVAEVDIPPPKSFKGVKEHQHIADVTVSRTKCKGEATVTAEGTEVLFAEFGTGVQLNGHLHGSPHPWGVQEGMTIGDYGKGMGERERWFFKDGGDSYVAEGSPAYNVMYHAFNAMKDEMERVTGTKLK